MLRENGYEKTETCQKISQGPQIREVLAGKIATRANLGRFRPQKPSNGCPVVDLGASGGGAGTNLPHRLALWAGKTSS